MTLEKASGKSDATWGEIGVNAAVDGAISYGHGKLPGVKTVTRGRNSMSSIYRSGLTKLRHHTAKHMSYNVMKMGFKSSCVGGMAMNFYYAIKQTASIKEKERLNQ